MRFGPVPVAEAAGGVLAHALSAGGRRLRKGAVLAPEDVAALAAEGVAEVTIARLDAGDTPEDGAAAQLAAALADGAGLVPGRPFTGRANLNAVAAGVVAVDAAAVAAFNRIDPGITLATVAPWARVAAGGLAATVKILPYAVPGAALARAAGVAAGALRLHRVVLRDAGLILTEVPGQGARLAEKAERATAARLARLGMGLCGVVRVAHRTGAIADALATLPGDMALILTGSATSDARDAGPAALVAAGGRLERFGLPVDPGNLTFWGTLGGRPVLGMPGSARSLVASGVDLVLDRLACGVAIDAEAVAAMGVGGLGRELPARGHPREPRSPSREPGED